MNDLQGRTPKEREDNLYATEIIVKAIIILVVLGLLSISLM